MGNLIALVTGANKSIGREIARQPAAVGHTVNNAGISSGDPEQVTDEDPGTFE
jgi:NAD(P)-dependent dehydrogenase (short-subunit alcohol dehydrogenase family)